jgi:hypothetical protein
VINPLDKYAFALRIPPPGHALLETTGRRTGRPRVTPVCDGLHGDTSWIVAQQGHGADYVQNIQANPRVRVKASCSAAAGGPEPRMSSTTTTPRSASVSSAQEPLAPALPAGLQRHRHEPLTVRIDLDPR